MRTPSNGQHSNYRWTINFITILKCHLSKRVHQTNWKLIITRKSLLPANDGTRHSCVFNMLPHSFDEVNLELSTAPAEQFRVV